ncbi:MAG: hypothetical protein OH319_02565 [Candidatus Parvarchaeota archaeon]|nr:hypothetical protein [Candidatus Jingweiarchaeum tengchongense]MCW1298252.1 hypothetical protein [Candidatus Jingweiarchaeum tengchongense]MCW1300049.1 hypothetical protein [Candidatus Jingweiarchaeum tengchongense]MCW1304812.1 hypothetical protein [Candidatus Jingweiarchaeum tengchongense]MCW1305402.1 hypothetical protein [Candidatus Jingweiarchaeum tengchongense]
MSVNDLETIHQLYKIERIKKEMEKGEFKRISELEKIALELSSKGDVVGNAILESVRNYRYMTENIISSNPKQIKDAYTTLMTQLDRAIEKKERYESTISGFLENMHSWRRREELEHRMRNILESFITEDKAKKMGINEEKWKDLEKNQYYNPAVRQEILQVVKDGYSYVLSKKTKMKQIAEFLDKKETLESALDAGNLSKVEEILKKSGIKGKIGKKHGRIIKLLEEVNKHIYNDENFESRYGHSLGRKEGLMILFGTFGSPILYTILAHNFLYPPGTPWITTSIEGERERITFFSNAIWVGIGTFISKLISAGATDLYDVTTKHPGFYFGASWELLPFYLIGGKIKQKLDEHKRGKELRSLSKIIDKNLDNIIPSERFTIPQDISRDRLVSMFLNKSPELPNLLNEIKEKDRKKFLEIKDSLQRNFENSMSLGNEVNEMKDMISYAELCGLDVSKAKKKLSRKIDEDMMKLVEVKSSFSD